MKINVTSILRDHCNTLYSVRSGKTSIGDLLLFYAVPLAAALAAYIVGFRVKQDAYNVSITFFGIFIALLLNIQVAIFGILQRKWNKPQNAKLAELQKETLSTRKTLLTELNANLSYLVLVSCAALFCSLLFYLRESTDGPSPAVMVFFYTHFLLTMIMVVKRAHALFHKEYRDAPVE